MIEYRWVKTSKSDFLEAREGRQVVMRLTRDIKAGDIGVLFTANDVVHVYALEKGEFVTPEEYGSMADRARLLITRAAKGSLRVMGQLWVSKHNQAVSIANVTLGAVKDGRFMFSNTGLTNAGCLNQKTTECERAINRIARLELLQWEVCD